MFKNLARYRSENNFVNQNNYVGNLCKKHDKQCCKKFWYSSNLAIWMSYIIILNYGSIKLFLDLAKFLDV